MLNQSRILGSVCCLNMLAALLMHHQYHLKPSTTMNSRGSLQGCKGNTCREASSLSMRLSSLLARATSSCTRPVCSPSLFLASSICKPQGVTLLRKHQACLVLHMLKGSPTQD